MLAGDYAGARQGGDGNRKKDPKAMFFMSVRTRMNGLKSH
jgi:hypothetical protein